MNSIKIRLGHTDSVNSVDKENFLDVELKNTSKLMHFTDIKETVDQYEQFKTERERCNKYRLITTINPYCTNVLFNTLTEIVYAEGSEPYKNTEERIDFKGCDAIVNDNDKTQVNLSSYGNNKPDRVEMVMNTEYSRPGCAEDSYDKNGRKITDEYYDYHPGYDIFDNHLLRNKTFKIVNKPDTGLSNNDWQTKWFNTIGDRQRYPNGKEIKYRRRESLGEGIGRSSNIRHLYDHDDLLEFGNGDAINANLTEENGWYGFINSSAIQSRDKNNNFDELNIGRVLNNRKSCEFIDMYPDRTLYSFNPKYNKYRHREEFNWEIILTYPYSQTDDYEVVKNGNCNGLVILSATKTTSPSSEDIILFRTLSKHGLQKGDTVRFFYKYKGNEPTWHQYTKDFIVKNTGNLENNEKDYYFYINDMDFIRLLGYTYQESNTSLECYRLKTNYDYTISIKEYDLLPIDEKELFEPLYTLDNIPDRDLMVDDNREYRFARVVGDITSKYYIRKFRKLPNFKYAKQKFTTDGSMAIDDYIENNAKEDGKMILFDKEQYKLAFQSTIYNDDSTQVTFTDTIDIENLVDNRGYPLTEIYLTIVKTNYGHKKWYSGVYSDEDVEFSHCFDDVSEGLEFSQKKNESEWVKHERQNCGDISLIYKDSSPYNIVGSDTFDYVNIRERDIFFGDIVEFNENECIEKSLQVFMHRFNTLQRESDNGNDITYHEIYSDDWDVKPNNNSGNVVAEENGPFSIEVITTTNSDKINRRAEGYYYQSHYRIPLREFGEIQEGQHYDINIKSIKPVQADAMYINITTERMINISKGDIVYLFDNTNDRIYEFVVTYIENNRSFFIFPYIKGSNPWYEFVQRSNMNWLDVCNLSVPYIDPENTENNRPALLFLRRRNPDIPPYAIRIGENKYRWRKILRVGDMDTVDLPEYAYANDAFYISTEINFFLKRQDPNGWNGLYAKHVFPNDIPGNIRKPSNYIYKEEKEIIC